MKPEVKTKLSDMFKVQGHVGSGPSSGEWRNKVGEMEKEEEIRGEPWSQSME